MEFQKGTLLNEVSIIVGLLEEDGTSCSLVSDVEDTMIFY